jgi:hypothetical protein
MTSERSGLAGCAWVSEKDTRVGGTPLVRRSTHTGSSGLAALGVGYGHEAWTTPVVSDAEKMFVVTLFAWMQKPLFGSDLIVGWSTTSA